jgi:hypothetical protein
MKMTFPFVKQELERFPKGFRLGSKGVETKDK